MTRVALAIALTLALFPAPHLDVPAQLSNAEFWKLATESSEPGGYFRNENLTNFTSNELGFQHVIPELVKRATAGRVYLGVGPEQNFTYMAAIRPKLAIIFDIRRGNFDLQLMYKALFEMARDRADFVSSLFAKPRPAGLSAQSSAAEIFSAFAQVPSSEPLYKETLQAIRAHLTVTRALPLPADDVAGIAAVYERFYWSGFAVRPSPTYADLMTATDLNGVARGLSRHGRGVRLSEGSAVAQSGRAGGWRLSAGRAPSGRSATYLRTVGATVSAFYLSNVEQYLIQDGKWEAFCRNVATLPLDASSTFVRSQSGGGFGRGGNFVNSLGAMATEVQACRTSGVLYVLGKRDPMSSGRRTYGETFPPGPRHEGNEVDRVAAAC